MKRTAEAKLVYFCGILPVRMQIRNDLHLARKAWHMVMGLVIAFIYMSGLPRSTGVIILGSVLGFDLFMEGMRLRNPAFNEKMLKFWGPVLRAHEINQMSTLPHYVSAAMIAVGIFPKPVAILSILYLACGDPIASFFGILYGHKGPRFASGKTLVGTSAGVLACALVTFIYLKSLSMPDGTVLALSAMGGLAGGMAELLPFDIDDNFTIPVISGFVLWLAFIAFGL
jgi:dolichol kinase